MALIIENGTNVANANSYVALIEARAYATARGKTLPVDDAALESQLIQAMDYLESYRDKYKGSKTSETQSLQWPRCDVWIDAFLFPYNAIPQLLKNAQSQLAIELHNGVSIMPNFTDGLVKREKVDVIEVEYSETSLSSQPQLTVVNKLLQPLFKNSGFSIYSLRV